MITGVRGSLERDNRAGLDYTAFGSSVAACFERAARLHPHRTAVCCRYGDTSYAQLNAGANRLAHRLLESGGNVGDRVAILMPQDRRIFLAIIATLKAGRIVLVLNGGDPPSRVRELLDDAEPTIIVTIATASGSKS
jgi:acyl-CoA synthetase (AMP-forming)/AMP-acid ligase II